MSELDMTDDGGVASDIRSELDILGDRMDELDTLISSSVSRGSDSLEKVRPTTHVEGLWPLAATEQADMHQLREIISLLKATLNSTTDGILVLDNDLRVVIYNSKFVALWEIPQTLDRMIKRVGCAPSPHR